MLGKKSSEKSWKIVFLYSHEYRDQKMWGKKSAKQFFRKDTNSASKKCWAKNRRKEVRKTFFYSSNIVTKKWGKKRAKQILQKHTNSASKKCWGKNRRKKCDKRFFIFTRIP